MIKYVVIAVAVVAVAACTRAPAPVQSTAETFTVLGSVVDQARSSITVSIRVDPPATEQHLKSVAEKAISQYRDQYKTVTIKSYLAGSSPNELPNATSILDNGAITHQITPGAATRKIPTH